MARTEIFRIENEPAALVVVPLVNVSSLAGDHMQPELDRVLAELERADRKNVVIDFGNVSYFGSVMLAAATILWKRVRAVQGTMVVCGLSEVARDVLHVSKFDQIWPIFPSRSEALQSLDT